MPSLKLLYVPSRSFSTKSRQRRLPCDTGHALSAVLPLQHFAFTEERYYYAMSRQFPSTAYRLLPFTALESFVDTFISQERGYYYFGIKGITASDNTLLMIDANIMR